MAALFLVALIASIAPHVSSFRLKTGKGRAATTRTMTTTAVSKPINAVLADFYSLFELRSCKSFSELFSENGSFLHPAVPQGSRGSKELKAFCKGIQEIDDNFRIDDTSSGMTDYLSLFRPDGPFMYLKSNGVSAILQPYFWSNLQKRVDGTFGHVANSGWQAITMNDNFKMVNAVEFWTNTATQRGVRPEIDALLDKLYSLFEIKSCEDWASAWTADGRFLHPAIPGGLTGTAQLVANCNEAQGMNDFKVSESGVSGPYRALFRPDGPYMLTVSGGLITILQPYIFTILSSSASKYSQFANSGWEVATIKKQPDGSMKFVQVIEYWSRDVQPFEFNPKQ